MRRALLLLALLGCAKHEEHAEARAPAGELWLSRQQVESQQLRVEIAGEREVSSTLDAAGRIAFDDLRVSHVFAPASGRIVRIHASPGQHVKKGDALLELDSPEAGAAMSDVGKAAADLSAAERDLRRQRELVEAHAGAQKDLDQAQSAWDRARAELSRAGQRADLFRRRGAEGVSQRFVLRAPLEGEVIARNANPGTEVQGQTTGATAQELFTIGSVDPVWAYADVFEVDLPRVKIGAPVQVKVVAFPDRAWSGRVDWISSTLDPLSRTARIRCTLRNPSRELLPEMYATVSVETPARKALAVPRSAVVHVGEERVVFVQVGATENGLLRFQRRRVLLEEAENDPVQVKGGLAPGEPVVVSGALLLSGML